MKILLFTDNLGSGGAQRQLVGLAVMLHQKGHAVKVCTYQDYDFYKSYLDENGVPNVVIPNAFSAKKRIWVISKFFKTENPEWVIAYQETPSLIACIGKVLGNKYKLIVSERNTTQSVGIKDQVRFFLYRWADSISPNSYSQQNWLKAHYPWMTSKLCTITNFVDLETFAYIEHSRRETPIIMVAASIWASKNTPGLIEAAKILKDNGVKCKILWYGKTDKWKDYINECNKKIIEYGLQEMVELLPKTKEIQKRYQEADYFCLPSFYEGTPNVICEAISTGLPVMCSDVCDNPYYVINNRNGILFNPADPQDIADKIKKLLTQSDGDYQMHRKQSRIIAEELLDANVFINKYLKILSK